MYPISISIPFFPFFFFFLMKRNTCSHHLDESWINPSSVLARKELGQEIQIDSMFTSSSSFFFCEIKNIYIYIYIYKEKT
jgi:hypothetical protein